LSGVETGVVLSLMPAVGMLCQSLWGQLADRSGRRAQVLASLGLGAALGHALLSQAVGFWPVLLAMFFYAIFMTSIAPMSMAVSLAFLQDKDALRLGRVRVMGSLGFAVSVLAFPAVLPWLPDLGAGDALLQAGGEGQAALASEPKLGWLFAGGALAMLLCGACALLLPGRPRAQDRMRAGAAERGEWRVLLRDKTFLRALALTFLAFLSMQGPLHMFPLLVRARGGGLEAISEMWLWMLLLEVPLVFFFGRSVARWGPRNLVAVGLAANALRWLVSGYATDIYWVTSVQVLHGVVVWGVMLALPVYVDAFVPERLRATGQGLLAMVGASFAGIASNAMSGWLLDAYGSTAPARMGGWLALLCACAVPLLLPRVQELRGEGATASPR